MAKEKASKQNESSAQAGTPNVEVLMKQFSQLDKENNVLKNRLSQAMEQIQFMSMGEVHKKLEWLWKVVTLEDSELVFGEDFVQSCIKEFKEILTPPEEEKK